MNPSSKGQLLLVRVLQRAIKLIALDARSLALFRVMIALTTITDVMTRFPDAHHHYSDSGMFPREFILRSFTNYYWITIHMLSGAEFVIKMLFLLEIFFGILLLVGYRTRLMTVLCWIMVCSVQNRNYILGHSGDTVHRLFLFWGIFLPLGRYFSVDNALAEAPPRSRAHDALTYDAADAREDDGDKRRATQGGSARAEVANFCTFAYTIQLLIMYYMAHHHKTSPEWREKGVAAWMALQLDYFRTWFGDLLLIWTPGVIFANFAVLKWQHWGSLMYFMPFYNQYFKAFVCLGFFAMHAGFGMAFYLETFTWATLSGVSGLVPGWVWDMVLSYLGKLAPFSKPIQIYVLPNCRFCMNMAQILRQTMLPGKCRIYSTARFPAASHPCTCGGKCNWNDSRFFGISVVDQQKNVHVGPEVFAIIAKSSPILYPLHYILRMPIVRKGLHVLSHFLHNHVIHYTTTSDDVEAADTKFAFRPHSPHLETSSFSASESAEFAGVVVDTNIPTGKKEFFEDQSGNFTMSDVKEASKIGLKVAKEVFVAFLLILIISTNWGNVNPKMGVPHAIQPVLWMFQLDQYWGMFAPRPPDITWWYNFEGYLDDGRHVELFNNGAMHKFVPNYPHTFEKPNIHEAIGNHRWFKLFENGINSHHAREEIRLYFGRWFCREYNARNFGKDRLHKYSIHFMFERLDMNKMDGSRYPAAKETIWNHLCYEK